MGYKYASGDSQNGALNLPSPYRIIQKYDNYCDTNLAQTDPNLSVNMAVKSESLGLNGQNNNSNAIALGNQRELSRSSTHKRGAANKSHSVSSNPGALRGISSKKKRSNLYVTNESDTSKKKSTLKSSHASQR